MAKTATHTAAHVKAFLKEVESQSDRGAAIVAASVIEELTKLIILDRLIELSAERKEALFDRMNAPLSSFSAKIELAFALGVIANELRLTLHLIRDIRNKFAHRIESLTFDHPDIATMIATRASPSVQAMQKSVREKFMAIFNASAIVLYGTWAADMRIRSLEETHTDHFLKWFAAAVQTAQGQAPGAKGANPASESSPPKPA
jgi:hypothetical protein